MKSVGICIGASTASMAVICKKKVSSRSILHCGNPKKALLLLLKDVDDEDSIVITGRRFRHLVNGKNVSEPEAIEACIRFLEIKDVDGVVSIGAETFMAYALDSGCITDVSSGNKCASGTGEFFLQQIGRMNLSLDEAVSLAVKSRPHDISGRCSVFCKSDCTHSLNKGVPAGEVASGLARMMAEKISELLNELKMKKVLCIGGVTKNKAVMGFLQKQYDITIPNEATFFEALGAAAIASNGEYHLKKPHLVEKKKSFESLPCLAGDGVQFKSMKEGKARSGDTCILGLDVGSTTTKAVLLRKKDDAILASVYLRTNGNPVTASVECYKAINRQVRTVKIIGLGVTGSGRYIAGLHALSNGIINEIIAHATAAAYFDKDVDTIFEIGGQDAKYTYLVNGVASDYAMNEACSAGTGSFLEEASKESLDVSYKSIAKKAMMAKTPPNFNDQCSAFISSDIKLALQEGLKKDDILAGLVYSVCMNYANRVKGNRQIGRKVFMQGGVCYNKAVPIAMSILTGTKIVVPPEPGLMGAFGVALEVKSRIASKLMDAHEFNLAKLIKRKFNKTGEFICQVCDGRCMISIYEIDGKRHPFGGACSRYYNLGEQKPDGVDYVKIRQDIVFSKHLVPNGKGKKIGILKSFLMNTYYPFFHNFFASLGFEVMLSDTPDRSARPKSSFCYPAELSHQFMKSLIAKDADYIFLPHVTELDGVGAGYKRTCVFVQGECYFLRSSFQGTARIISPIINFSKGRKHMQEAMLRMAQDLGITNHDAKQAFDIAQRSQEDVVKDFLELGKKALQHDYAVVLFGRPYNAFAKEANLAIPRKFSAKGIPIIPHDILPTEGINSQKNMYWYMGQLILRNARFVKTKKNYFGAYITNFSCGPDSFLLSYFRKIMGQKPSLTLELDSHSSDAGIETRIEAFLDITKKYMEIENPIEKKMNCTLLKVSGSAVISDGRQIPLTSPEVQVLIPSMGTYGTKALTAAFRSARIDAVALPESDTLTLQHGRASSNCKECLPFILTTGSMVKYVNENKNKKKMLFFMPHGHGPCRQGQYHVRLQDVIYENGFSDVAVLTLNDENSYGGLGTSFYARGWISIILSDIVADIALAIQALSRKQDLEILDHEYLEVVKQIEHGSIRDIFTQMEKMAARLSGIKLKAPLHSAKKVSLIGEIYVRRDEFSRMDIIEKLAEKGFVVKLAPVAEYIYYCNYIAKQGIRSSLWKYDSKVDIRFTDRYAALFKDYMQKKIEKRIKKIFAQTGLYEFSLVDVDRTMQHGRKFISEDLLGESILTVGFALREIIDESCGIIALGPFACMPSRLAESILKEHMRLSVKESLSNKRYSLSIDKLPFLNIETDGNPFPQLIEARLEVFMMQAERLHKMIKKPVL